MNEQHHCNIGMNVLTAKTLDMPACCSLACVSLLQKCMMSVGSLALLTAQHITATGAIILSTPTNCARACWLALGPGVAHVAWYPSLLKLMRANRMGDGRGEISGAALPSNVVAHIAASLPNENLVGPMRLVCRAWCETAASVVSYLRPALAISSGGLRGVMHSFPGTGVLDLRGCVGFTPTRLAQDADEYLHVRLSALSFDESLWQSGSRGRAQIPTPVVLASHFPGLKRLLIEWDALGRRCTPPFDLEPLSALTALQSLELRIQHPTCLMGRLSNQSALCNIMHLTRLILPSFHLEQSGIAAIAELPALIVLDLSRSTPLSGSDMQPLRKLTCLRSLSIGARDRGEPEQWQQTFACLCSLQSFQIQCLKAHIGMPFTLNALTALHSLLRALPSWRPPFCQRA